MTTDYRALCEHLLASWEKHGGNWLPSHEDMWNAALDSTRAALAQPEAEAEGVTDEALERAYQAAYGPAWERGEHYGAHIDGLRAVLFRYARPTPQPIPVSERLPGAGDCDAEGRCWWFAPEHEDVHSPDDLTLPAAWELRPPETVWSGNATIIWLPHWALPFPSPPSFSTMTSYRVEAHDGKNWSFGIRMHPYTRIPVFCDLALADCFPTEAEATDFLATAQRLCGGTLRVAPARDSEHK